MLTPDIRDLLHGLLIEKGKTLSLAESLTGGSLAYHFVSKSGCSTFFQGSVVAYSARAKQEILGVSVHTLKTYGEVSCETAKEMAEGALRIFHTDYAIAVTGIAGPSGATTTKPVGLVVFAIATIGKPTLFKTKIFKGERLEVIDQTVTSALLDLMEALNE